MYMLLSYIYIYIYIHIIGGGAPKRGSALYRCLFPPNASAQWQPDGLTIHTQKRFLGAGFLGALLISLILRRCPNVSF